MTSPPITADRGQVISVVVPCFNEAEVLPQTHERLIKALGGDRSFELEIVYVDDGSSDRTPEILDALADTDERVVVVSLTRNFGHQAAVTAGMQNASGDAVAVIDADLQDPPEKILQMVEKWREGYDVVYAVRTQREAGFLKGAAYRLFYRLIKPLAAVDVPLDSGDFSLMSRAAVDAINALPERNRYVRGLRAWIGFRQIGIPYTRPARAAGETKYTILKLVRLGLDGIVSMSSKPLSFIFALGVISSIMSALTFTFYLIWRLSGFELFGHSPSDVPGFTSIVLLMFLLGGIQLVSLGVIGEYVGRIYDEAKNRPTFLSRDVRRSRKHRDAQP